jgi:hypothetical protein
VILPIHVGFKLREVAETVITAPSPPNDQLTCRDGAECLNTGKAYLAPRSGAVSGSAPRPPADRLSIEIVAVGSLTSMTSY